MAKKQTAAAPESSAPSVPENAGKVTPKEILPDGPVEIKLPPKLEARNAFMEQLAGVVNEVHKSESGEELLPDDTDTSTAAAAAGGEPQAPEPGHEPAPAQSRKVKIKVNGQEQEVDEAAILDAGVRTLQKQSAADQNLQTAAEKLRQAEEILNAAQRRTPAADTDSDNVEPSATADADVDALARAIQFGTEAEVKQAVKTLLTASRGQGTHQAIPSTEAIVQQVNATLEFNSAIKQFQTDFSDVWADDNLRTLAFQQDAKLQQEIAAGTREAMTYTERFAEAGKAVQEWVKKFGAAPGSARVNIDPDKQAAKANAGSLPTAGGRPSGSPTAPLAPPNPTSIVAQMRQARGQL